MRSGRLPLMGDDEADDEVAPYVHLTPDPDEVEAFIDWVLDDEG